MQAALAMTARQHAAFKQHLFPGDGLEAAAVALCGRAHAGDHHRLVVHRIVPIPHDQCERRAELISWKTELMVPLLADAARRGMAILKIHSHPTGFPRFSSQDDRSDRDLFASIYGWFDDELPHASAVMMPDGRVIARVIDAAGRFVPMRLVSAIGEDLTLWFTDEGPVAIPAQAERNVQAFGEGTYRIMQRLRIAFIGASGTGSPALEASIRSHAQSVITVDPDMIEWRNLNRILHSTVKDAKDGTLKVVRLAAAAREIGFELDIVPVAKSLHDPEVIRLVSTCDVAIGCLDAVDARALLNRLATFYTQLYIDVGVRLDADGNGGIDQVCGQVHFFQPGLSSFFTRGVFTPDDVAAAALKRADPVEYVKRLEHKYIGGVRENRPAVMPLNMLFAGMAVMELFARIHPYRTESNEEYAVTTLSLSHGIYEHKAESAFKPCPSLANRIGRGDLAPLLDMPELSALPQAA
jgi:ThiF family protein/JAB domain-containing protein similar to deubiquitination enzymes